MKEIILEIFPKLNISGGNLSIENIRKQKKDKYKALERLIMI